MKQYIITLTVLLCTLFAWQPTHAATDDLDTIASGYCGSESDTTALTWVLTSDSTLTIAGSGDMRDYNFYTEAQAPWKAYISQLKHLVLSDSITSIGDYAFSDCNGIVGQLNIPDSSRRIGYEAFYNCGLISGELHLPDSLKIIEGSAFQNCISLSESLVIPNAVTTIGYEAFENCRNLKGNLILSKNLRELGGDAFYECRFTGDLEIPEGITHIYNQTFRGCYFNGMLTLPSTLIHIEGMNFIEGPDFTKYIINAKNPPVYGDNSFSYTYGKIAVVPNGSIELYELAWGELGLVFENPIPENYIKVKGYSSNGRIVDVNGNQLTTTAVERDSILTLNVVPDEGYEFSRLLIDGADMTSSVTDDGWFNTPAIDSTMNIIAEFSEIKHTIRTYTVGSGAVMEHSVSVSGDFAVKIYADRGNTLRSVKVSGMEYLQFLEEDGTLRLSDIRKDVDIVVDATDTSKPSAVVSADGDSDVTCWTADDRVFASSDQTIERIELVDIQGRTVATATPHSTTCFVTAPLRHSSYIVQIYDAKNKLTTAKVVVR